MYKVRNRFRYFLAPENCTSLLSYICFILSLICIPFSAFFMLYNFSEDMESKNYANQLLSIFISLLAIYLIGIGNFLKRC